AEDTPYRNVLPLPALPANDDYFTITYLRATNAEFQVSLEDANGETVKKSQSTQRAGNEPLRGDAVLCLAIGGYPPVGLKKSLIPPKAKDGGFPQPGFPQGGKGLPPQPMQKDGGPGMPGVGQPGGDNQPANPD